MNKRLFLAFIAIISLMSCLAVNRTVVWNEPAIDFGNCNGNGENTTAMNITRVELNDSATTVYMTVQKHPFYGNAAKFAKSLCLLADGKKYPVVSTEGIELEQWAKAKHGNSFDIAFRFQPLPLDTKSFDFIEGEFDGATLIYGVRPVEERWKSLFPSYWRNDKTGEWEIAFLDDCAIYDCKIWDYKNRDVNSKTGTAEMSLVNGDKELKVSVGKNDKGHRDIKIDGQKFSCSMITSQYLPDYPTADTRTDFVDTGYKTDTITIIGWIKDMPERYKSNMLANFTYNDFYSDILAVFDTKIDDNGHFLAKIPVSNSSGFRVDRGRSQIHTMLEAGKTYFFLNDFNEGKRLWMGDDVRLQNELLRYPLNDEFIDVKDENTDFDDYIAKTDNFLTKHFEYADSICSAHPALSTRFKIYSKNDRLWEQARNFGQSVYDTPGHKYTPNARKYAYETFWANLPEIITLYQGIDWFIRDFFYDYQNYGNTSKKVYAYNVRDHFKELAADEAELSVLKQWDEMGKKRNAAFKAASSDEEKDSVINKYNSENADLIEKANAILERNNWKEKELDYIISENLKRRSDLLDSLKAPQAVKELTLYTYLKSQIDHRFTTLRPVSSIVLDTFRERVTNPEFISLIENKNERNKALAEGKFDKLIYKSVDNLDGVSEGEELLRKILEPFQGKFVLLDIWGTWCGPCVHALKSFQAEYVALSKYDIAYMFLASNSPEETWKETIEKYNIKGDNVAHYNLSHEQQAAIEKYLNVHSFPSYRLFDRKGNLLDIPVDPINIVSLKNTLERLSGK